MFDTIDRHFKNNDKTLNIIYSLFFIFIIGFIDYLTGKEIILSVFYALPVLFISWYGSIFVAIVMAVISILVSFLSDSIAETNYFYSAVPYWNALVRFSFLCLLITLISKLKNALQFEITLARIDSLTRLNNGRGFRENATLELQRSSRTNRPFTVAYIDLDNFKSVNDAYGHDTGDALLLEVATIFRNSLRNIDQAARLGGDEFALLLPETDMLAAKAAVNKVRDALLYGMQQKQWPVTASIGVLTFEVPPSSVNAMIKMVDELMYTVKNSGKNNATFHCYKPSVIPS